MPAVCKHYWTILSFDDEKIRFCNWTCSVGCEWLPACFGPCNKQLLAHKGENICTFDAINMNRKEFLIYAFKFRLLQNELNTI